MNTYTFFRNADVKVIPVVEGSDSRRATIVVNNELEHTFKAKSRVSQALAVSTAEELSERLSGGHYFFAENSDGESQLVDFRDGNYKGFVHNDNGISNMVDTLGVSTHTKRAAMVRQWDRQQIEVPLYKQGGVFDSILNFLWSPFSSSVNSEFNLVRQICENGMVGTSSLLNTRVPIVNRWEEHLDIAAKQIQNKIDSMMVARLGNMSSEHASVLELNQITQHAMSRLNNYEQSDEQVARLRQIAQIASPKLNLGHVYQDSVFSNSSLSEQMPGHVSKFDAYNMVTEINSHTLSHEESSNHALDKLANKIVFAKNKKKQTGALLEAQLTESAFGDPDSAFWGVAA